jgi:hypothetical protein
VGTKSRWVIMSEIDASLRQLGMDYRSFAAVRPISPKARLGDEWLYRGHLVDRL